MTTRAGGPLAAAPSNLWAVMTGGGKTVREEIMERWASDKMDGSQPLNLLPDRLPAHAKKKKSEKTEGGGGGGGIYFPALISDPSIGPASASLPPLSPPLFLHPLPTPYPLPREDHMPGGGGGGGVILLDDSTA